MPFGSTPFNSPFRLPQSTTPPFGAQAFGQPFGGGGFGQSLVNILSGQPLQQSSVFEESQTPDKGFVGGAVDWIKQNKDVLGMAGKTAAGVAQAKMAFDEQKARRRQEEDERNERERKRRNDEALAPLRAQVLAMLLGQTGGR